MYKIPFSIIESNFYTMHKIKITIFSLLIVFTLNSCNGKLPGADARKFPQDPKLRVKKNIEEGRGFRLMDMGNKNSGVFEFASSNELWRASLDTLDFMPLASVNYGGGIIITDWYSTDVNSNESIKISIRFLTNEVRADALDIKVFNKKCKLQFNCIISEKTGNISTELKRKILRIASIYKEENVVKDFEPYIDQGESK